MSRPRTASGAKLSICRTHHPWEVTEHQAEVKVCGCGHRNVAGGVKAPVQYGPGIIDRIASMHCYQRIPFQRIGEWFRDEWNVSLSSGPVMRAATR